MELEQEIFKIILHSGNARGFAYEALDAAEGFAFDRAEKLIRQAEEELGKAHQLQTQLIQAELNGNLPDKTLLLIHAQDHLMTAMSEQKLIERMIRMIKKLKLKGGE
ncbi:PTS lactose/cellobiose transporter subunit IIA [Thermoactinomyces mirandus]